MTELSAQHSNYVAFDSDLPSVAAMAAAEVDSLLRHEGKDLPYLAKLSEIIGQTFSGQGSRANVTFRLVDPVSIDVMSKSVTELRGTPLHSIDELSKAIYDLTMELEKVSEKDDDSLRSDKFLERLKQFCIALSRYALASKEYVESPVSSADYRR